MDSDVVNTWLTNLNWGSPGEQAVNDVWIPTENLLTVEYGHLN